MPALEISTPALLFPAVSLLFLSYTRGLVIVRLPRFQCPSRSVTLLPNARDPVPLLPKFVFQSSNVPAKKWFSFQDLGVLDIQFRV